MPRARSLMGSSSSIQSLLNFNNTYNILAGVWGRGGYFTFELYFWQKQPKILRESIKENTTNEIKTIISWVKVIFVAYTGSGTVRWKFVHGLFENAIYGGRIDNTFDAKVLQSYLLQYFEQAVFPGQVSWRHKEMFLYCSPRWSFVNHVVLFKVIFAGRVKQTFCLRHRKAIGELVKSN